MKSNFRKLYKRASFGQVDIQAGKCLERSGREERPTRQIRLLCLRTRRFLKSVIPSTRIQTMVGIISFTKGNFLRCLLSSYVDLVVIEKPQCSDWARRLHHKNSTYLGIQGEFSDHVLKWCRCSICIRKLFLVGGLCGFRKYIKILRHNFSFIENFWARHTSVKAKVTI